MSATLPITNQRPAGPSRRLLWSAVVVVAVVVLLVAVDRIAASVAAHQIATRVQHAEHLAKPPSVHVTGFPFLTQALGGTYSRVDVNATDLHRAGVPLSSVAVSLYDVRVSAIDVLAGRVHAVPVGHAQGKVVLSYADLDALVAAQGLSVSYAGNGQLHLAGRLTIAGREVSASAVARPTVDGGDVLITAESVDVGNGFVDGLLTQLARERLRVRIPSSVLPFGVEVRSVVAGPHGVTATGVSGSFVLQNTRSG